MVKGMKKGNVIITMRENGALKYEVKQSWNMLFTDDKGNTFKICFHRPAFSSKLWVCSEYVSGLSCSHNCFKTIEECLRDFTRFSTINKIASGFTQKYVIEILKDRYEKGIINVESGDGFLTNFTLSILYDIVITK